VRRIAPFALSLIVAGALAPPAHPQAAASAADAARLARFLPIARAAWPGSPCAGREVVHVAGDDALRAQASALAGPGEALDGMAAPETCDVWLASGLADDTFCTVLVHELGHLAGRGHTTAPGDVMNGDGDIDYRPCDEATAPSTAEMVQAALRSALPAPRAAWRITCGPKRGAERRCVARRGRSVRRFEVTESDDTVTIAAA
jgi:hypothetical protein